MTNQKIIDELFKRTRIVVPHDDPVLNILALANIILENQSDITAERISVIAAGFEHTAEKTADSIVETLNKAAGILQLQLNEIEATKKSISLPELLDEKYEQPRPEKRENSFKEKFFKTLIPVGIFSLGLVFGLLICGFLWVFFR